MRQHLDVERKSAPSRQLALAVSRRRRARGRHPSSASPTENAFADALLPCKLPRILTKSTSIRRSGGRRTPQTRATTAITDGGSRGRDPRLRGAADAQKAAAPPRASTGAPRAEEGTVADKSFSGCAATSTTPPASTPRTPRLCTHRDPSIPRPPAAGAAAEGEESAGSAGGELVARGGPKNRLLHCRWGKRRRGPCEWFLQLN